MWWAKYLRCLLYRIALFINWVVWKDVLCKMQRENRSPHWWPVCAVWGVYLSVQHLGAETQWGQWPLFERAVLTVQAPMPPLQMEPAELCTGARTNLSVLSISVSAVFLIPCCWELHHFLFWEARWNTGEIFPIKRYLSLSESSMRW